MDVAWRGEALKLPSLKTVVPEDWYGCEIVGAEVRCTKAANNIPTVGSYLLIRLQIEQGMHRGREVYSRVTLHSHNDKARHAGMRQLRQLYNSIGITRCEDSEHLIGKKLQAHVVVKSWKDSMHNDVKKFSKYVTAQEAVAKVQESDQQSGADTW